ncbi:peptidoglycan DD-metalloendopeptidase family protein [Reichenbachiella sp. MALMAid0571]|uniref:peptidoglycan DD-metalloendopeptidase family protein n=1 Tax=Reichenbachiella sp. MALMAid0571 TaxID=3143939 RepID=UPI0032DF5A36
MTNESLSQNKKKRLGDFFKFKNKKIEIPVVEQQLSVFEVSDDAFAIDTLYLDSMMYAEEVNLQRELSLVHEDTAQIPLYFNVPVQVSEQLKIDSVWVTLREYYSIWDSKKVNPYELDGEKFKDTLNIPLHYTNPELSWTVPISKGHITSPFGLRRWRWHYGTDLRLDTGDSVKVAFDGIVRVAHYDRYGYGHYVLVRHYNGLETLYGHFKKGLVRVGDEVKAGDVIGLGGSTGRSSGSHLHFEVRYEGNAIDPTQVFDFGNDSILADSLTITPETFSYLKEARKIRYHKVRSGDTLGHISYRYGVSINQICRLNGISRNTILRIGQRLRLT